jgi:hypothetical protein
MTEAEPVEPGPIRRSLQRLGLVYQPGGKPRRGNGRRSRYGIYVSRRLDEDLEELRTRLDRLERGGTESPES